MADQLPIIGGSRAINSGTKASTSLIGRGLSAIQNKETGLAKSDLDARYRQARDIYNRITDYGEQNRFNVELLPKQGELLKDPRLLQLQPLYNLIKQLADVFTVFQQLADAGYGNAYFPLAIMYRGGQGISQNIDKADYYGRKAFDWCFANQALNDPEIWTDLGWMYHHEYGVAPNNEETESFFYNAFELSHANAPYNLRKWYEISWVSEDDEYRMVGFDMYWFRKAADQGYVRAQYNVGFLFQKNPWSEQDFAVAALWYREAAEQGFAEAQTNLGWHYASDEHGNEDTDKQAVYWFKKAVKQNHPRAQTKLGWMFQNGLGVKQDYEQAVFWYRKSAEQGYVDAQCHLAFMYQYGCGVEQDYNEMVFYAMLNF